MYKFSIIIPHKNIPDLLQRCLDSIPQRDDIQTIIVDDDSDPAIVDFEHFPGLGRPNTEIYFDKTGKGAGRARNVGLDHATGKWLLFADADDRFEEGINQVLCKMEDEDSDIVFYDVMSRDSQTLIENKEAKEYSQILKGGNILFLRYRMPTPWMKFIKRSLIDKNNIRFEEVLYSNDTWFSALCGFYARNISIIPIVGYCWMTREGSLWRRRDILWCVTRHKVCLRLYHFMKDHGEQEASSFFSNDVWNFVSSLEFISPWEHIKGCVIYGWEMKNWKVLFKKVPRLALHYLKLSAGINRSISDIFMRR